MSEQLLAFHAAAITVWAVVVTWWGWKWKDQCREAVAERDRMAECLKSTEKAYRAAENECDRSFQELCRSAASACEVNAQLEAAKKEAADLHRLIEKIERRRK